ncbi:hypothetical protein AAFC00_001568 [Neodothiora populina]|uniref:Altered inheritance of mitochondria protein 21 n=1 Tax=Neodothiora populina TaxID=2781224 RepID=A0ABR3PPB5_9PEZI
MSAPQIPPRPSRSPRPESNNPTMNIPPIPPRPQRRLDRSISPSRAEYSRSPLNDLPAGPTSKRSSAAYIPAIVGEEGLEYESVEEQQATQTRNVAADLPIHAPKASAAAAGVGGSAAEASSHPLKAKPSFSRSNLSLAAEEEGPPSVGLTVPMLKYAGDAQAPSPMPTTEDATESRNHHRKRSSRHEFGPPGSYGLHGHGLNSFHGINEPMDKFDEDWYKKHPEEYKKEKGRIYDPGHPSHEWALSSDDLNKLVHQSSSQGIGMGTTPEAVGTPSEQIGYLASEEYTSRMNSPRPLSLHGRRLSSGNQPPIASPLRKASAPADDQAMESDIEDIIHVDAPAHRVSKIGGGGYDPPKEDFGPEGGNTEEEGGWVVENGYGTPILASDEVAKNTDPTAEYQQPAISPEQERRGSDYHAGWDSEHRRNSGEPLSRVRTRDAASGAGTPLKDITEYEPLFPEDEKEPPKPKAVDHLKRPDLARHSFPSQDIWEDVPESLQYETTVDTPQQPEELGASTEFELPEKEQARKDGNEPTDRADFLSEEAVKMAKPHFKPGVADEMRPNLQQRFPSRDIWEDTPDSLQYETTVETPQMPEDLEASTGSLPPAYEGKPLPKFNRALAEETRPDLRQRFPSHDIWEDSPNSLHLETTVSGPQSPESTEPPSIPPRPSQSKPLIPPRPATKKPQVPARPARTISQEKIKSPPLVKAKPVNANFASLRAGFMNDLNSRLKIGPQAPKKEEELAEAPVEKAPLVDARKGRARGPARRKPAAAAAPATADEDSKVASGLAMSTTNVIWQIDEAGHLEVPSTEGSPVEVPTSEVPATEVSSTKVEHENAIETSTDPVGAEGDIADAGKLSEATLDRANAIQPGLEEALADSRSHGETPASGATDVAASVPDFTSEVPTSGGAAAKEEETDKVRHNALTSTPVGGATAEDTTEMVHASAQTGEKEITIPSEEDILKITVDGNAPEEGSVITKADGEEIVSHDV